MKIARRTSSKPIFGELFSASSLLSEQFHDQIPEIASHLVAFLHGRYELIECISSHPLQDGRSRIRTDSTHSDSSLVEVWVIINISLYSVTVNFVSWLAKLIFK